MLQHTYRVNVSIWCCVCVSDDVTVLRPGHWMVDYKCRRRRDCRMSFTAVCGVGLISITVMSCRLSTTVKMRLASRRTTSVSIHITTSEWKNLVSNRAADKVLMSSSVARIWCQEGHKVTVFISFVVIRPNSTIQ